MGPGCEIRVEKIFKEEERKIWHGYEKKRDIFQIQKGEKFSRTEELLWAKAESMKIHDGLKNGKNFSVARVYFSAVHGQR